MYKFYILLSIVIAISITGCTFSPNDVSTATPSGDNMYISEHFPTYNTIEGYEKYISAHPQRDDFITYDMLKDYGSFCLFVNSGRSDTCTEYSYDLIDSMGIETTIFIIPASRQLEEYSVITSMENPKDLRSCSSKKGVYTANGISYYYSRGKLRRIAWQFDKQWILVDSTNNRYAEYPITDETLVGRLLNTETAEAAVVEFNAKVAQARAEQAG